MRSNGAINELVKEMDKYAVDTRAVPETRCQGKEL